MQQQLLLQRVFPFSSFIKCIFCCSYVNEQTKPHQVQAEQHLLLGRPSYSQIQSLQCFKLLLKVKILVYIHNFMLLIRPRKVLVAALDCGLDQKIIWNLEFSSISGFFLKNFCGLDTEKFQLFPPSNLSIWCFQNVKEFVNLVFSKYQIIC